MIALDTNVVVRFIVADEPRQAYLARELIGGATSLFMPKTALLETAWVLRQVYGLGREQLAASLIALIGLPNLVTEDRDQVTTALQWALEGMDFADALHLASSRRASEAATFDQTMARDAQRIGTEPPVRLLS